MSPTKCKGSSHHKGKDPIVVKSPFEKEGDEDVSPAKSNHSEGEETVHDPNSKCFPLLDPCVDISFCTQLIKFSPQSQ